MKYIKDTTRIEVKFLKESTNEIILTVPITLLDVHDYFKTDYVNSVLRNTFGEERFKTIGNVIIYIDQKFNLSM